MPKSNEANMPSRAAWRQFFEEMSPQTKPETVDILGQLRMVGYSIRRKGEQSLEQSGLSEAQFRVLMHLLFSERIEQAPALNPSELSRREGTNRNTISSLVRSLEKEQLVERTVDERDRRKFNIRLTDSGRDLVHAHAHAHFNEMGALVSILDEQERVAFGRILQKLNAHIHSCPD